MFKVPKPRVAPDIRFGADGKFALDGGINLWRQETALSMNQASNILNVTADDKGTLSKRKGQTYLDNYNSSGEQNKPCNSIIYKNKIIKQVDVSVYEKNLDGSNIRLLGTLSSSSNAFFIPFQGLLYLFNGTNFMQYDGTTFKNVDPYVPIVSQSRNPAGTTSTLYEPLNLLTGSFTDMFSPDGTTKTFVLSLKGLDATTVTCNNGTSEGAGFTVDRTNGTVTFTTAPALGTNTLKITAAKTNSSDALQIKNCTRAIEFSSRLFITGNHNYPNRIWKTGLTSNQASIQANYFPASGLSSFDAVTSSDEPMTAFIKKYDKLIYLKASSTLITYNQTQSDGTSGFPISSINETIGCDMPGSVQLVDNMPVFFNSKNGGYALVSTTVIGENELKNFSICINGNSVRQGLLQESEADLQNCCSFNDGKKYYLAMPSSGRVYVWDYSLGYNLGNPESLHWFVYNNIYANNFFMIENTLCYSSSKEGRIIKFIDALNDFGQGINGKWKSKLIDFGISEFYKNVTDIWLTTRANSNSTININYYDDNGTIISSSLVPQSSTKRFKWSTWKWSNFTWKYQRFAPTLRFKPGIKNVRYFQIEITNNNINEDLSIVALVIKWIATRKVR